MKVSEIQVSYSNSYEKKIKITNSKTTYDVVLSHWSDRTIEYQEEVKLLLLNRANIVLGIHELSKGGTTGCIVDIKMILAIALKCNAYGLILIHNHPSGNLKPSEADKSLTSKLREACEIVDINMLDHLIISKDGYYSFSDESNLM
ncbi:JAB domain-containing protein [Cellulophaga lytica]|uniref:JAB domain-containing protein n=1 Tax=Cellulophaga lytica TaxID=979 RepID=UPI000B5C2190|nr:JAB domain-containing protein [Cellulophaga lytica]SNQ43846.1 putative DNA repair protein RadC [Cellulophaga lytica]